MRSHNYRSVFTFCALLCVVITLSASSAGAAEIHGTVFNGTTGTNNIDAKISIIKPADGMAPQLSLDVTGGEFAAEGLSAGIYMARIDYKGVTYNQQFEVAGAGHVDLTVNVYEPTTDWAGVRVVVPHYTAARHDDHLVIERVYDIYNESDPPRTITGDKGYFRFPLPAEMHNFNGMMVQYGDVPVERQPAETGEPGIMRLEYPIRPGVTRVVMSYTAEYGAGAVAMSEQIQYDIASFTIYATDNEMAITSPSHNLVHGEGPHASVSRVITGLKKGETLTLGFSGGSAQPASSGGRSTITVVPNDAENLSFLLMIILALALVAFVGIAMREPRADSAEALHLSDFRNVLIARMAKLDDLHETGAVPAAAYQSKRAEIKKQIASLTHRLKRVSGSRSRGKGAAKKQRAAGEKRSSAR